MNRAAKPGLLSRLCNTAGAARVTGQRREAWFDSCRWDQFPFDEIEEAIAPSHFPCHPAFRNLPMFAGVRSRFTAGIRMETTIRSGMASTLQDVDAVVVALS
jgi:hypothetical protein